MKLSPKSKHRWFLAAPLGAALVAPFVVSEGQAQDRPAPAADQVIIAKFQLDQNYLGPKGPLWGQVELYHNRLKLTNEKPAGIVKEPVYKGSPLYTTFRAGNGPKSEYFVVLDEPLGGDEYRIYIDVNRNGDLTDDGDGKWATVAVMAQGARLGPHPVTVRASWGQGDLEVMNAPYSFIFYRSLIAGDVPTELTMRRQAARVGDITIEGKTYRALMVENDSDGVFAKYVDAEGKPRSGKPSQGVNLIIDLNNNGQFEKSEYFDIRGAVTLFGKVYQPRVAIDGSQIQLMPATMAATGVRPTGPVAANATPELLQPGTLAPNFEAEKPDGSKLRLSDYRGKIVILDFWATWCGPCKRSMPHLQKVWSSVKDQGVVALGICVWDEKDKYLEWIPENKDTYTFQTAYDPAKREPHNIAKALFNVSGIPTMYVIDREGKVVEAILGFRGDSDDRLEKALQKAGVNVPGK